MSKVTCLNAKTQRSVVINKLSGITNVAQATQFKVSPDTIRRVLKNNQGLLNLFEKDENGVTVITNPENAIVIDNGDFICNKSKLTLTGDIKDGIIICQNIFTLDESDMSSPFVLDADDLGVYSPLKVGLIFHFEANYNIDYDIGYLKYVNRILRNEIPDIQDVIADGSIYTLEKFEYSNIKKYLKSTKVIEEPEKPSVEKPALVWSASSSFITISEGRQSYHADRDHPNFKEALLALADDRVEDALTLINIKRAIEKYTSESGRVRIEGSKIYFNDFEIENSLVTRILDSMSKGESFEFYIPFLENMMANPSRRVVTRIFDFLEANDIEITADGYFIAWKKVRNDFKDIHSGKFDNSPGVTVEMPRNQVDEDDNVTCSSGLHVCSKSYLGCFGTSAGNRVVKVKVNPVDVVSIPVDYGNAKMRTCKYEVLEEVNN